MSLTQFTTPTLTLTFSEQGLDLRNATGVYVTFTQGNVKFTKSGTDLTIGEKSIGVHLSQEDSGKFHKGDMKVMANWLDAGERMASKAVVIDVDDNLLDEVIT